MFNTDLEMIETWKSRLVIPCSIDFSPGFSYIDINEFVGREFKAPQVDLNVYGYYKPKYIDKFIFYATPPNTNKVK